VVTEALGYYIKLEVARLTISINENIRDPLNSLIYFATNNNMDGN